MRDPGTSHFLSHEEFPSRFPSSHRSIERIAARATFCPWCEKGASPQNQEVLPLPMSKCCVLDVRGQECLMTQCVTELGDLDQGRCDDMLRAQPCLGRSRDERMMWTGSKLREKCD